MKRIIFSFSVITLSFALFSTSCSKEENNGSLVETGQLQLGFSEVLESVTLKTQKTTESTEEIAAIVITIESFMGDTVYENKKIAVQKFNNNFLSDPIDLVTGSYQITKFLVLDNTDSVLYAAPLEGSSMAYLVNKPLPIEFDVFRDQVTKVSPEVISTENKMPEEFGYTSFSYEVIEVIDFLITVFSYDSLSNNYKLSDALLTISVNDSLYYRQTLDAITNKITIADRSDFYKISVSKDSLNIFVGDFSSDSLKKHFEHPLTVILDAYVLPTEGLILYYPFDNDANDYSGSNNHCIEYSDETYINGVKGMAHDFNGTSDYLELSQTLDGSNGLSFSFWVNSKGAITGQNGGVVISKYNMAYDYHSFYVSTFGFGGYSTVNRIGVQFYASQYDTYQRDDVRSHWEIIDSIPASLNRETYNIVNPRYLELNEWVHCVINTTETEVQIWINGELTIKKTREYDLYFNTNLEPTYIGNNPLASAGSNNHLHGALDELRVYNRGLTETEIQALFHN